MTNTGIESDDFGVFLQARSKRIFDELKTRIELDRKETENEEIEELISGGETDIVEFKSTLRYDLKTKSVNKILEYVVAKTIAAFLNTGGGHLLIGVDDKQNILGLSEDMITLKKQNVDGFELQLIQVIKKYIGNEFSSHIKISFPECEGAYICLVKVSKSSSPVFIIFEGKEDFFIRAGCSSQPLSRVEQSAYEKEHWSNN